MNPTPSVRDAFGLPASCAFEPLGSQHVWRVTGTGEPLVLKHVSKDTWGLEKMRQEHQLLGYLSSAGVPVARPRAAGGATWVEDEAGYWVLMRQCTHRPMDFFAPQSRSMYGGIGRAIGTLHRALAATPHAVESFTIEPWQNLSAHVLPDLRRTGRQDCLAIASLVEEHAAEFRALDALPRQRIHGDCHTGNVCIDGDRVTGFIDCDHLPLGSRLFDLAEYLVHIIKWDVGDREKAAAFLTLWPALLAGYDAVYPLTDPERAALWAMLAYVPVVFYHWKAKHNLPQTELNKEQAAFEWFCEHRVAFC